MEIIKAAFLAMIIVFLSFLAFGSIMGNILEDVGFSIFLATIILSGIIAGCSAWIVETIKENKK